MTSARTGLMTGPTLLILLIIAPVYPLDSECSFYKGRDNFVLDTEDSVKDGANLILVPAATTVEECKNDCCLDPNCNLALIEKGEQADSVTQCFLFNCMYKKEFVCRFVSKPGFTNYILDSVYEEYLKEPETTRDTNDKRPVAKAGRDVVVQPSENVTLDGVESWDDKGITYYRWSLVNGNASVVLKNTKYNEQINLSNLYPGVYVVKLVVKDSSGQIASDTVSVLVLTPEQSDGHCMIPKKVGLCRGAFPRWHYNAASGNCENFTFGGCKGNRNNYLTLDECTKACNGVQEKTTRRLHPDGEQCGSTCHPGQFTCKNGCCLENALECDTVSQCSDHSDEVACDSFNQTFSRLLKIDVDGRKAFCTEPPRTGLCRASHARWYYDPVKGDCHRFTYGGCGGNDNNFEMKDKCLTTCRGVNENDIFGQRTSERLEEEDESRSGSAAVAVVLGVVILALLAVLGYCFLKKRKERSSQHQAVPTSDTTVYNSTTKPV
ncbi:hypothetical protein DPEC_G00320210 [Dallia pectoralis]|uniref:Uncharacterized protein n=1 Tax=Dallia pectoralis TaxID=75939 RepID=A0ACC2F9R4_DALPE|nr:hypothetical protein DPEC_G00320210 [Dallia pectoralis]